MYSHRRPPVTVWQMCRREVWACASHLSVCLKPAQFTKRWANLQVCCSANARHAAASYRLNVIPGIRAETLGEPGWAGLMNTLWWRPASLAIRRRLLSCRNYTAVMNSYKSMTSDIRYTRWSMKYGIHCIGWASLLFSCISTCNSCGLLWK